MRVRNELPPTPPRTEPEQTFRKLKKRVADCAKPIHQQDTFEISMPLTKKEKLIKKAKGTSPQPPPKHKPPVETTPFPDRVASFISAMFQSSGE